MKIAKHKKANKTMKNLPAYIIGTGLVLFVVNQPSVKGILISNIGLMMIYAGLIATVLKAKSLKDFTVGSKWVWIPLAIICVSIIISVILSDSTNKASLIGFLRLYFLCT